AAEVNSGLTLHPGRLTSGTLTVTAGMTEGGGSATSAPLTISLTDPPAAGTDQNSHQIFDNALAAWEHAWRDRFFGHRRRTACAWRPRTRGGHPLSQRVGQRLRWIICWRSGGEAYCARACQLHAGLVFALVIPGATRPRVAADPRHATAYCPRRLH